MRGPRPVPRGGGSGAPSPHFVLELGLPLESPAFRLGRTPGLPARGAPTGACSAAALLGVWCADRRCPGTSQAPSSREPSRRRKPPLCRMVCDAHARAYTHAHTHARLLLVASLDGPHGCSGGPLQSSQGQKVSQQATGKWSLGRPHTCQRPEAAWTLGAHFSSEPPGVCECQSCRGAEVACCHPGPHSAQEPGLWCPCGPLRRPRCGQKVTTLAFSPGCQCTSLASEPSPLPSPLPPSHQLPSCQLVPTLPGMQGWLPVSPGPAADPAKPPLRAPAPLLLRESLSSTLGIPSLPRVEVRGDHRGVTSVAVVRA